MISTYFHPQSLEYDGTQLRSHFALERFRVFGNSLVAFAGPCRVKIEKMVDIEDVINDEPISSERMLHFILEVFGADLEKSVLYQRLLVTEIFKGIMINVNGDARMNGDDIFCFERKLSVSIATVSPVSMLCHTGINISPRGAPVEISCLEEMNMDPEKFAHFILGGFKKEFEGVHRAMSKVRAVS